MLSDSLHIEEECWKYKTRGTMHTSPLHINVSKGTRFPFLLLFLSTSSFHFIISVVFSISLLLPLFFLCACALRAMHFLMDLFASFLVNYLSSHSFLRVMSGRSSFITLDL